MSKNLAYKTEQNNKKRPKAVAAKNPSPEFNEFLNSFFSPAGGTAAKAGLPVEKAKEAFAFFRTREPGKPKVEISLPEDDKRPRTIIKVLNNDKTFLVDSVIAEITRQNFRIYEIFHPVLRVKRDASGKFSSFSATGQDESLIYLEISSTTKAQQKDILTALGKVFQALYATVDDWHKMLGKVQEAIVALNNDVMGFEDEEVTETIDFLKWISDNHFTFLGYANYDLQQNSDKLKPVVNSGLGLLRSQLDGSAELLRELSSTNKSQMLEITKSNTKALVHRSVFMDVISVKKFNSNGKLTGEHRFFGLFASSAYYQTTSQIPVIRQKAKYVQEKSGFIRSSHSAKIAQLILDAYPRDEIFQCSAEQLLENTLSILKLSERPDVGFFVRRDRFDRFLSCLIFVPKEKFDTSMRFKIQAILEKAFNGTVTEYYTQITDSPLSRLHLIITPNNGIADYNLTELQQKIAEAANLWSDELLNYLNSELGERKGTELAIKYESAFPKDYIATHTGKNAVFDIIKIESALAENKIQVEFYQQPDDVVAGIIHLKVYNPLSAISLSDILPVLENMGLRVLTEKPYTTRPAGTETVVRLRDFQTQVMNGQQVNISEVKKIFETAFEKVLGGEIENDQLNKLVLYANLPWRDVVLLRGYSRYLRQVGLKLGLPFFLDTLAAQASISKDLVRLFHENFDPALKKRNPQKIISEIEEKLANVSNLNEDRAFRRFLDTIRATIRTNFFLNKNYISFKFDAKLVPDLPLPHPLYEVFVYSTEVEGIHLRGGTVARGGLRWSDRHEDFRTEILGLMKAQMVKNSVIVPVGSKGGFVVKAQAPEDRDAKLKQGIECYKTFLHGILDVTDNIVNNKIAAPKNVVRKDSDDPYLVVAADKGTATFSDIANGISAEYKFWLGDAFASGGSAGYDHKGMAITARGGWISVMRHFREIGIDTQTQDFTVAGVGDMAGDVFGNGMLLSKHIRLVAAFNHMHIFLDPNPDAAKSYIERERLFKLPRSSWEDYGKKLISKGGGIFKRSEKTIKLTPEIKAALSIRENELSPDELIRAILKSPVDLLWNGGIGTYVKAESESNRDVGDKNNDNLRVNGGELRCKVVGEGGNLGCTQLGRIEYAKRGGRINTDAIDNSAGVDCSDHEVNIKIALAAAVEKKKLNLASRDKLLEKMTDDVAALVLRDNYLQTQALSVSEYQGLSRVESQRALIHQLESIGLLNRGIEYLPGDEEISKRLTAKKAFTRPELAVLLAYSKIWIYNELLASNLPDQEYFKHDLMRYFPAEMQKKYSAEIEGHKLRREIVATFVTNSIVNRAGSTFFHKVMRDTGLSAADIARGYTVTRDAFKLRDLWQEIESLDSKVDSSLQYEMYVQISKFVERFTLWLLRNLPQPLNVEKAINEYAGAIEEFRRKFDSIINKTLAGQISGQVDALTSKGVPAALAKKVVSLDVLASAGDIALVSKASKQPVAVVGKIYFQVGERLKFTWLKTAAQELPAETYWQRLAISNLTDSLFDQQRKIAAEAVKCGKTNCFEQWLKQNAAALERHDKLIHELRTSGQFDLAMFAAAVKRIETLTV